MALEDVSLDLAAGEIHAVVGENGAGKTTLMAILSGALRPDRGSLQWEGRPAAFGDVRAARQLGIGMVHQEPQLVPSLRVAENIGLGRLPRRGGPARLVDRGALREQAEQALRPLRVTIDPARRVEDLRVGERQLVAIARALCFGARLIILDESWAWPGSWERDAHACCEPSSGRRRVTAARWRWRASAVGCAR